MTGSGSVAATGNVVNVDAGEMSFDPTCVLDVHPGRLTLIVYNSTSDWHNFSVPAQHVDRVLPVHAAVLVRVVLGHSPVVFVCKYHRAAGMVGILVPAA